MAKILCGNCNDPRFDADRECEIANCEDGHVETSPSYSFTKDGPSEWFCPRCDEEIEHESNPCECGAKIDWPIFIQIATKEFWVNGLGVVLQRD